MDCTMITASVIYSMSRTKLFSHVQASSAVYLEATGLLECLTCVSGETGRPGGWPLWRNSLNAAQGRTPWNYV